MNLWWWIGPLIATGIVFFIIGAIISAIFSNSDKIWPIIAAIILSIPMVVGIASFLINVLFMFLYFIWTSAWMQA